MSQITLYDGLNTSPSVEKEHAIMFNFEETAARLFAETHEAIIYASRDGIIQLWNGGAEEMFGWPTGEAIGQPLDIIVPEKHRKPHWTGWDRVMETGETKYGSEPLKVPGLRKDGSTISLEFSITILKDDAGQIEGVAAFLRDVTADWEERKALKQRLRELEKTTGN